MKKLKKFISIGVAVLVGFGMLYFAFKDVPLKLFIIEISKFQLKWIPILFALLFLDIGVRAIRWRLLLKPVVKTTVLKAFQLEAIGLAINNILFLRLGEVARAIIGAKEMGGRAVSIFATIIVERLCDTIALLCVFVFGASMLPDIVPPDWSRIALAVALILLLVLSAITIFGDYVLKLSVIKKLKKFPKMHQLCEDVVLGTRALRSIKVALPVSLMSICLWLSDASIFWATAQAMQLRPILKYFDSLIVVVVAAAGSALPALPGAWGNFEAFVKEIMVKSFGYPEALALSYATVAHLVMYIGMTLLGIVFFYRLGYTFKSLGRAVKRS